jgi:hypothetical protein
VSRQTCSWSSRRENLFSMRPLPMAGQATAASLQQFAGSGTGHDQELSDLQSRWPDLQLAAQSQNIDIGVWNVMLLQIKHSVPQQITRLGKLLQQLDAHLLNCAQKQTESAYESSISESQVEAFRNHRWKYRHRQRHIISNLNAASGSTSESVRRGWRSSNGQSGGGEAASRKRRTPTSPQPNSAGPDAKRTCAIQPALRIRARVEAFVRFAVPYIRQAPRKGRRIVAYELICPYN